MLRYNEKSRRFSRRPEFIFPWIQRPSCAGICQERLHFPGFESGAFRECYELVDG